MKDLGKIVTFYSYKGGVGRTMAMMNVACLLAKWGKKVLIVDFDLEAPGLEKFFYQLDFSLNKNRSECPGIVNIMDSVAQNQYIDWKDCIITAISKEHHFEIDVLTAGQEDDKYAFRLQNINWDALFEKNNLQEILENIRNEWKNTYDFVLIDSRTGVSDIGGICTIYLPDIVTFLFTTNSASLNGSIEVIRKVRMARNKLPHDRRRLVTLPIPSRDESQSEHEIAKKWSETFSTQLSEFFTDWLPKNVPVSNAIELFKIPYKAYWSFGERLPVLEEGTQEKSIGYTYEKIALLLANDFDWNKVRTGLTTEDVDVIIKSREEVRDFATGRSLLEHLDPKLAPKRILSLSSGGIRGSLSLGYLKKIESILREKENNPSLLLCEYFDLIGGTSTGSIIAAALAVGMSVDEVVDLYKNLGSRIFDEKRDWWKPWETLQYLKAGYSYKNLENFLKEVFGNITLGSDKIKTGLCILAKRADTNTIWPLVNHPQGKFFDTWLGKNKNIPIWQALRASTAAPTYFVPQILDLGDNQSAAFIDGGVSSASDPSLTLLKVATLKGFSFNWELDEEKLMLVSVGTGQSNFQMKSSKLTKASILEWAQLIPDMLIQDSLRENKTILQWLSSSPNASYIDMEVESLRDDFVGNKKHFRYLNYNLLFTADELNSLGMHHHFDNDSVKDLLAFNNTNNIELLYQIGLSAANAVKIEHFK